MADVWSFCRSCGARVIGAHEKCPLCDSANVHIQNIGWLKLTGNKEPGTGDFFPTKEEAG
jgi:hypothetical protein